MAPVGGREARDKATGPLPGVTDVNMADSSTTRTRASAASRSTCGIRKGSRSRSVWSRCRTSSRKASRRACSTTGAGIRGAQEDQEGHHLRAAVGHGRAGHVWALSHRRPDRECVCGPVRDVGTAGALRCRPDGAIRISTGWAPSASLAMLSALFHRERTGEGQWIDASQTEVGLFINGPAPRLVGERTSLDAHRQPLAGSPRRRTTCIRVGDDRWITIACFTEAEWNALIKVAEHPEWDRDPRFTNLAARLAHQEALDALISEDEIAGCLRDDACAAERRRAGGRVSDRGRPLRQRSATQGARMADRGDGTKIGRWPIAEVPIKMSASPPTSAGASTAARRATARIITTSTASCSECRRRRSKLAARGRDLRTETETSDQRVEARV